MTCLRWSLQCFLLALSILLDYGNKKTAFSTVAKKAFSEKCLLFCMQNLCVFFIKKTYKMFFVVDVI